MVTAGPTRGLVAALEISLRTPPRHHASIRQRSHRDPRYAGAPAAIVQLAGDLVALVTGRSVPGDALHNTHHQRSLVQVARRPGQRRFHAQLGLRGPSIQNWNADRGSQAPGLGGGRTSIRRRLQ